MRAKLKKGTCERRVSVEEDTDQKEGALRLQQGKSRKEEKSDQDWKLGKTGMQYATSIVSGDILKTQRVFFQYLIRLYM